LPVLWRKPPCRAACRNRRISVARRSSRRVARSHSEGPECHAASWHLASDLAALVHALPADSQIKSSLTAAIASATAKAQSVEQAVGDWFDSMMERAIGGYKRWAPPVGSPIDPGRDPGAVLAG
jgi:hypothetical protein